MKNLLFELGVEELPSRFVRTTEKSIKDNIIKKLEDNKLNYGNVKTFSTPRRIAILIENIDSKQEDINEIQKGPSYNICFSEGKPTKVLTAFLQSNGLQDDEYEIIDTPKGKYIQIRKNIKGKYLEELLPSIFDYAIRNIYFERSMKWGNSSFKFIRPIKWILALLDDKVFDFEFEGIKSSNITRGLRNFGSQNISINDISEYESKLMDNFVIADPEKRKNKLLESIKTIETPEIEVEIDNALLDEVVNLIEYPYAIIGDFDKKFLDLPEQLITITMKTHQRYFPVRSKNKKLSNNFVVIRNANEYSEDVKKGNEKVIRPRLEDSKFFFDEDLKINLASNLEKLKNVIFQKDMGTIYDKVVRMKKMAQFMNADQNTIRAIELCKCDLVSAVINEKEFTSLQGFMGSIYAKNSNEADIVCEAIRVHYSPKQKNDNFPNNIEASIVSIVDKLDTAMGAFCVNLKPTSSKDPYAIRRAVQGICYVAFNNKLDYDYITLSKQAFEIFKADKTVLNSNAVDEFLMYFRQRIETVLSDDYDKELINLVLEHESNFSKIIEKLNKLSSLENDDLINLIKRIKNIVKDNKYDNVEFDKLENEYDTKLYNIVLSIKNKQFSEIVDILLFNKNAIDEFFDNVKISDNENRVALLNNILNNVR